MLQPQPINPSSSQAPATFPQTQPLNLPNTSPAQPELRLVVASQQPNNPNTSTFSNPGSQRVIINNENSPSQYKSVLPNGQQNFSFNQSSLRQNRQSKRKNKYSFKRNIGSNSVAPLSSFNKVEASQNIRISQQLISQINQYKTLVSQQEFALARIRDIALNRRNAFDLKKGGSTVCVRQINALTEIYNLSLVNITGVNPLEFVEVAQINQNTQSYRSIVREEIVSLPPASQVISLPPPPTSTSQIAFRPQFNQQVITVSQNQPQNFQAVPQPIPSSQQAYSSSSVNSQQIRIETKPTYQTTIYQPITQTTYKAQPQAVTYQAQLQPITYQTQPQQQSQTVIYQTQPQSQPQVMIYQPQLQSQTTYQTVYEVPQPQPVPTVNSSGTSQKNEGRYEAFQSSFNESKLPTQTFKYQAYTSSYVNDLPSSNLYSYPEKREEKKTIVTETYAYSTTNANILHQDSPNFILQTSELRELRQRVNFLQEEKATLIDKIRVYEKSNNFQNLNNKESMEHYHQEIAQLKAQIADLTLINNNTAGRSGDAQTTEMKKAITILEETIKQYQEQLIQAQNHIIFLENSRNGSGEDSLQEIKYLRDTIAKYTEHVEQLDIERRKYEQLIQQREHEIQSLGHDLQEAHNYIQTLQQHIQNNPGQGGVSYEAYEAAFVEAGRKAMQVVILLQEINRLNHVNNQLKDHLEKAEEYIINLQEGKPKSRSEDQFVALQSEYNRTLNVIGEYQARLLEVSEENKSLKAKVFETSAVQSAKVGGASSSSFTTHQEYQKLLTEIKDREKESLILRQQFSSLNQQYNEVREHLEKAQEYIIQLQENHQTQSPVNTLLPKPDTERLHLEEQVQEWQSRVVLLEKVIAEERFEKQSLQKRSETFTAEYEDMEYRYKTALDQLSKRYDQLLEERNSLATKLSEAHSSIQPPIVSEHEVQTLKQSLNLLNSQLIESKQHLETAEAYIEQNAKNWEEASTFKQRHDQLQSLVTIINSDLESTRKQNEELASRLRSLEVIVSEVERLKAENESLTIVIREKDNAGVSTSLKQIDEVQSALANYTRLYQESEVRVKQLELQNQRLQLQAAQLEEYLSKAESFIIEQEANDKKNEKNVKQLTEQLLKAQEHIFTIENSYNSLLKQKDEYETISRTEIDKSAQLLQALQRAEAYIFELESRNTVKK